MTAELSNINSEILSMTNLNLSSSKNRKYITDISVYSTVNLPNINYQLAGYWNNSIDPVTSLTLFSGTTKLTGKIKILRQVESVYLNPIKLVHNKVYTNEDINLTIDVTDCDNLEIDWSGTVNNTNTVKVICNNDSTLTNYRRQIIFGTASNISSSNDNNIPFVSISNSYISTTCTLKFYNVSARKTPESLAQGMN